MMDWKEFAACRDADPELFFPLKGSADEQRAKAICGRCRARSACLSYAVDNGIAYGVYGGMTEDEREVTFRRGRTSSEPAELATVPRMDREVILHRLDHGQRVREVARQAGVDALTVLRVWAAERSVPPAGTDAVSTRDREQYGLYFPQRTA